MGAFLPNLSAGALVGGTGPGGEGIVEEGPTGIEGSETVIDGADIPYA